VADVVVDPDHRFAQRAPVLIIGAGACGAVAALAARDAGVESLVLERDEAPRGSSARCAGLLAGGGTRMQAALGIEDSPSLLAADIQNRARNRADPVLVRACSEASARAIEWLIDRHRIPLELVDGEPAPGHSVARMHALAERTGAALLERLLQAVREAAIPLHLAATATRLVVDEQLRVLGAEVARPDGSAESIGCDALVLACGGFGAHAALVSQWIPELREARFIGPPGHQGDALAWGQALGAGCADLSGGQVHGAVVMPLGAVISWSLMMHGALQVNRRGDRFGNEHDGYAEAAARVLEQPAGTAFVIYDARLHDLGEQLVDYGRAAGAGAIRRAGTVGELAQSLGIDAPGLERTVGWVNALAVDDATDDYGRRFHSTATLLPPYYGVEVTAALLRTQGGLVVDRDCRVLTRRGKPLPNLYAAGGAARGISGDRVWGYLAGNGLLSAVAGGFIAGNAAARCVLSA
jgi:fumarate reductase flavoprotein subunit